MPLRPTLRQRPTLQQQLAALPLLVLPLLGGCGGSTPLDAPLPAPDLSDESSLFLGDGRERPIATRTLLIDPVAMRAEVVSARRASGIDQLYLLALDEVVPPTIVAVESLVRGLGSLELTYAIVHPFEGPNRAAPPSGKNRADLGFAGRTVCVFDFPAEQRSYFGGSVTLAPLPIRNPDGFVTPGAVIPTEGLDANTFPYFVVVDEEAGGNRAEFSNGGHPDGNYSAAQGGWQRSNMGAAGAIRWTGYGVLHQGQRASRTMTLDTASMGTAPFAIDLHILAKYQDPRGGVDAVEQRANRLPAEPRDDDAFLYRLPHAALDCERIEGVGTQAGLLPNDADSSATIAIRLRDWDARALESTQADFGDEINPAKVPAGTSGTPTVEFDLPDALTASANLMLIDNDSLYGGDSGTDSGEPGDELVYTGSITNTRGDEGLQSAGSLLGLIRATDPEASLDRSAWELALDPTLAPLPADTMLPIVYQVIRVPIGDFGVEECPVAPKIAADIDEAPSFSTTHLLNDDPGSFYTSIGALDFGSWRTTAHSGIIFQAYHDGTGDNPEDYDLYSINTATGALTQLTDLDPHFSSAQVSSLETDLTNRLLFSQLNGGTLLSDMPVVYANARANIGYLDYAGAMLTSPPQYIDTDGAKMIAITLGPDGNLFAIDTDHTIHVYDRQGSGSYEENLEARGDIAQTLDISGDFWVCDFASNFYNGAFFMLIKLDDGGASTSARVYRVECDGTVRATIAGNPNPLVLDVYEYGGSLSIDNHALDGTVLQGAQDAQILVGGYADPSDLYVITSELQITASVLSQTGAVEFQPEYCGTGALAKFEIAGFDQVDAYSLPSGWE